MPSKIYKNVSKPALAQTNQNIKTNKHPTNQQKQYQNKQKALYNPK